MKTKKCIYFTLYTISWNKNWPSFVHIVPLHSKPLDSLCKTWGYKTKDKSMNLYTQRSSSHWVLSWVLLFIELALYVKPSTVSLNHQACPWTHPTPGREKVQQQSSVAASCWLHCGPSVQCTCSASPQRALDLCLVSAPFLALTSARMLSPMFAPATPDRLEQPRINTF